MNNNRNFSRGGFNRNRFGKPSGGGQSRFSNHRSNNQNRAKSKLGSDVSIFIKKAAGVTTEESYTPHNSFADFKLAEPLQQNILKKGYTHPTPIQDKAIQSILDGRDLIGMANTGTGKTAAFLIPTLNKIYHARHQKALIITPTRELATQINEEFKSFAFGMRIFSTLVIGGASMNRQIWDIRRNPNVIVATPGRLKDLIEQKVINLDSFRTIILDEVDLMVDIGFINEVKYFIALLPKERQSLFFSATVDQKVREVLNAFVQNPVQVSVQQQQTSENVEQDIVRVINRDKKVDQLHDLLNKQDFNKVMIFGRTKHGIEKLDKQLKIRGFNVGSIHGNKSQGQRQRVLQEFKQNNIQILLATDVASRGLDIDNVSHVINYDLPETYDDYVHRIGRTGRANKKGVALTFVE